MSILPIIIFIIIYILLLFARKYITRFIYYGDTAYYNFLINVYLKLGIVILVIYYYIIYTINN